MANLRAVMKSGHLPTLFAAFLYSDFCFAIWLLNSAMGPYITEAFHLPPAQTGLVVSVPILAGALGGAIIPNAMGLSKQHNGSFGTGFVFFAILAVAVCALLFVAQRFWIGKGGKALGGDTNSTGALGRFSPAS